MPELDAHLDVAESVVYVTEAQYTRGSLVRRQWADRTEALEVFEFLRDRASTDWVRLYEVTIRREWTEVTDQVEVA